MEQIKLKTNSTNLVIYINGKPDLTKMPDEKKDLFVRNLALTIDDLYKPKRSSRKKY